MAPVSNYVPSVEDLETLPDQRYHQDPEDYVPETPGPVLPAATNEKLEILEGLLRDGRFWATAFTVGPLYGPWRSALSESILAKLPEHARVLVKHGANINGFPNWVFSSASSRFIRGRSTSLTLTGGVFLRTRDEVLSTIDSVLASNQAAPITQAELALRRKRRFAQIIRLIILSHQQQLVQRQETKAFPNLWQNMERTKVPGRHTIARSHRMQLHLT